MATSKMKITVEAEVAKANAELQKINGSIDKLKNTQEKTNKVFDQFLAGGKVAIAAGATVKAIQKVVNVSKQLITLHEAQVVAETRLEGALIASGNAIGFTTGELKRMAKGFQDVVTYNDEVIMGAQGTILAFQNIGKDIFPDVTKASLDVAAALGRDVTSSAQLLGNALNDPIMGMSSLRQLGVSLSEEKQDLIKKLSDENNIYEAQKVLMAEINSRYEGMAERIGALDVNKISSIKSAMDDLSADLGNILTNRLSPVFDWVNDKIAQIGKRAAREAAKVSGDYSALSMDELQEGLQLELGNSWKKESWKPGNWNKTQEEIEKMLLNNPTEEISKWLKAIEQRKKEEADAAQLAQQSLEEQRLSDEKRAEELSALLLKEGKDERQGMYTAALSMAKDVNDVVIRSVEEANALIQEQYDKIEEALNSTEDLTDEEKERFEFAQNALTQQKALNEENLKKLRGENDEFEKAQAFIEQNNGLLNQSLEFKLAALEADIEAGRESLKNADLSENEKRQIEEIIRLKEQALEKEKEANKEINIFLEENKNFISQTVDERKEELETLKKQVEVQLLQKDLTEDQITALKKILKGIDDEIDGYKKVKSWVDVINEAVNKTKPEGWDEFLDNLQGSLSYFEDITSGLTSAIKGFISSNMSLLENETKKKVQSIQKDLDDLVKKNDEARKKMDERQSESMKALKEQYDADAISYEEYQSRKADLDAELSAERNRLADEEQAKQDEIKRLENEYAKKKFDSDKRNNIATTVMNGAMAAVKAFADLGPIAGGIAAAVIAGLTAAQVASISQQTFIPALKDGGVALSPKFVQIGDGDEPEMVLPLSKAKDFGFGSENNQPKQIINVTVEKNHIYGIDDFGKKAYDAIVSAQRVGKVPKAAFN